MQELLTFIRAYDGYIMLGLVALNLISLVYAVSLSRAISKLKKKHGAKLADGNVGEILDCLTEHSGAIADLGDRHDSISAKHAEHAATLAGCMQKFGLVRFNAFDDVGGEQSFAMVLLDADGNGIALSSIYGRQDSRLYAKAIVNSEGERPLSDEEQRALGMALNSQASVSRTQSASGR